MPQVPWRIYLPITGLFILMLLLPIPEKWAPFAALGFIWAIGLWAYTGGWKYNIKGKR